MNTLEKIVPVALFFLLQFAYQHVCFSQPVVGLEIISSGFNQPVDIANAGDNRLFIAELPGRIRIIHQNGAVSEFLNIESIVATGNFEQGLLGLVFDPNYITNGFFYVDYINNAGNINISRFHVSAGDSDVAEATSEAHLLSINLPTSHHYGGDLNFGPDGYLYISVGDGHKGDPANNSQDTSLLVGKMLRMDVHGAFPYAIPPDNPFVNKPGNDLIWSYGFRNPWRFSFDRLTGDMYIGDVGQNKYEEVDFQPALSAGGQNYGWRCYEGHHVYDASGCAGSEFTFPVEEYFHDPISGGNCVIGGFMYRGSLFPALYGSYVFCDEVSGNFWTMTHDSTDVRQQPINKAPIVCFGEDKSGEIYAANIGSGEIYHITDQCSHFSLSYVVVNDCPLIPADGAVDLTVTGGKNPFTYIWSTGAITQDISGLNAGSYLVTVTDSNGCVRSANPAVNTLPVLSFYADNDQDGFGNLSVTIQACSAPPGYVADDADCNDANSAIHPGASDICNTIDDNCDGTIDENAITATIDPTGTISFCSGTPVKLMANPGSGITYQWKKGKDNISGATNRTYKTSEAGHYKVRESNSFGCSATSASTHVSKVANPAATITPLGSLDICNVGSVVLQANGGTGLSYQWRKETADIANATNQTYTAAAQAVYRVVVTNSSGCSKISMGTKVTNSCKEASWAQENIADEFLIYPNPGSGQFVIDLKGNTDDNEGATITIFNNIGQIIYDEKATLTNGLLKEEVTLNSSLPSGIYLIRLVVKEQVFNTRYIYQK